MLGKCLCGEVQFEVVGQLPNFYQCHCSLCRKLTGSASDTATFVDTRQFIWVNGVQNIKSFTTATGYRSDFCNECGSNVPHLMNNKVQYWVPAGLLEGQTTSVVSAHLFVKSKATWDVIGDEGILYTQMPKIEALNHLLAVKAGNKRS